MNMLPTIERSASAVETSKNIISLVATCLGLVVIIIGLKYAMDIFFLILAILKSPADLAVPVQQIADIIRGQAFEGRAEGGTVFLANIIALTVYCCGVLLCAWLTLALMHTGARIVSLSAGDRSAVKKLLQSAFGRSMRPKTTAGENDIDNRDAT